MLLKKKYNIFSYSLLFLMLALVILSFYMVLKTMKIRLMTEEDVQIFQKNVLFNSYELFKPLNAMYLISNINPENMAPGQFRREVLDLNRRILAHDYFLLPVSFVKTSEVFRHGDPLFLLDEYELLAVEYKRTYGTLARSTETLKATDSDQEFLRAFKSHRINMASLAASINQLNNFYSKLHMYYLSHVRRTLQNTARELNVYIVFLLFLSSLLIVSVLSFVLLQRRSEKSLRESEEELRLLLNSTAEGIYGIDQNGLCTFTNPSCLNLLGYSREEDLLGKDMHQLVHHSDDVGAYIPSNEYSVKNTLSDGEKAHYDQTLLWRADKSSFLAELWSYPIKKKDDVVGAVVTFVDITGRKQVEEALVRSSKMAAVGQLASGIAHEINNPLATISACAEFMEGQKKELSGIGPKGEKIVDYVQLIREETCRAAGIIGDLLDFSRVQSRDVTSFRICDMVRSTMVLFSVQSRHNRYHFTKNDR